MTTYSTEFLLGRIYKKIEHKNVKKVIFKSIPKVTSKNRKTFVSNFDDFCNKINRNMNDVIIFIKEKLQIDKDPSYSESTKCLQINNMYKENIILDILGKYIKTYVECAEASCGSKNTEIIKENRINFILCKSCNSKKALAK